MARLLEWFGIDIMVTLKIKASLFCSGSVSKLCGIAIFYVGLCAFQVQVQAQVPETNSRAVTLPATVYSIDDIEEEGYKVPMSDENEFNNYSDSFVLDWRNADPEHEDTEFGEFMYNEASTPTKLEMLRLISKDTPSMTVLLHAVAMGVDIENILKASIKYEPEKASDLTASAVSILPVLANSKEYRYAGYELEDLDREDESEPYQVQEVIDRFFEKRSVLRPYPDWFEGQYHFLASAAELKSLQTSQKEARWYQTKSTKLQVQKRPIFVSLYEATGSVLVDGEARINEVLEQDPNALLPVVFVFNRLRERSIDQMTYPKTLRGIQKAYNEKSLMLTPVPEWQHGEYHMYVDVAEFYDIFEVPEEEDFEPEAWQNLLEEAEDYSVNNTSFLMVILSGGDSGDEESDADSTARLGSSLQPMYAAWDNPRTEAEFQYVSPQNSLPVTLKNIMGKGMIFNRPDLLAALSALGVSKVPVSYYYVDSSRVKPYVKGGRALMNSAQGVITRPTTPVGGGFSRCASPPCVEQ